MSIATQFQRIEAARNTIRNKLVALKLVESTAKIDDCATAVAGIEDRGAVAAEVKEGESYTVPRGWHNGSGTVTGVSGGGNYALQAKTVTPTKSQQSVVSDDGYYGLSGVTVEAIPEAFQDVTPVTAGAADVLATKIIVGADGKPTAGTMANNGAIAGEIDGMEELSFTVPKGYHNGTGKVTLTSSIEEALAAI